MKREPIFFINKDSEKVSKILIDLEKKYRIAYAKEIEDRIKNDQSDTDLI